VRTCPQRFIESGLRRHTTVDRTGLIFSNHPACAILTATPVDAYGHMPRIICQLQMRRWTSFQQIIRTRDPALVVTPKLSPIFEPATRNPQPATRNYMSEAPASASGLRSPLVKQTCAVIP
jgi:hypothetical protein